MYVDVDVRGSIYSPSINEIHTKTFPNRGPKYFSTNLETGKRGAWTSIPRKPHTLNSLRGHGGHEGGDGGDGGGLLPEGHGDEVLVEEGRGEEDDERGRDAGAA